MKYYQGTFSPKNPEKYNGNPTNITYRSSWELKAMKWMDSNPSILKWSSEETVVWYISPMDNKRHRYFPDFVVTMRDNKGIVTTRMLEIKPHAQSKPPEKKSKVTKRYIAEVTTYAINNAKWEAAKRVCESRGWTFHVITERELYGKNAS